MAAAELTEALGVEIDPALLELALTHRSFAFEHGNLPTNERLEFLGDAVLGLVVTEELYRRHPELPEGDLARMRASIVNARALAQVARTLGLGEYLRLGRGEEATGGRDKPSILADTVEAVLGALYLTTGLAEAQRTVLMVFGPLIDRSGDLGAGLDWKTSLQELASRLGIGVPYYRVTATGPDHNRTFTAAVEFDGRSWGEGAGSAKKHAEQEAAEAAWRALTEHAAAGGD
ncbi:MAG: ribonuclease [Actinomycetota bacterium]|nr:ribonuclease [Actinomycetota bacterium]